MTKIQELIASAIDEIISCDESRSNEDKRTKAQCAIAKSLVALAMLIDRPEVVRCKDCKYGNLWSDEQVIVCDKLSKTRNKNWFCADGVKR